MTRNLDILSLTRRLLSFNTVNPPGRERDCAQYIGGLLERAGFKIVYTEYDEGRTNLIASREGGGERDPLCFSGHLDTVPLGTVPWSRDPFEGAIEAGKIYGRGSSDMKGGLAAMILAAIGLSPFLPGKGGIKLVLTAGEEQGCEGAAHLRSRGRELGKAGALVVGEPSSNYPI
ncbi:MAG: M20/M25/M40 family metallo-hydrolase, partial [Deltaproteobacteria bacterium]|nr:M20/M25/M40 family metallo-hydrolase [Deltaproteobacteria bacterium]